MRYPRTNLTFCTQNLYLGSDITPVLEARSPEAVPGLVDACFGQVLETDFPARSRALARQVGAVEPDVIGLQEVAAWQAALPDGSGEEVPLDYLALLLEAFQELGLEYCVAAESVHGEAVLPSHQYGPILFENRNVILTARDLKLSRPFSGCFSRQHQVRLNGDDGVLMKCDRGWTAVDVTRRGRSVRFVTTHLEQPGAIQLEQIREILALADSSSKPIVLSGDFNIDANNGGASLLHSATDRMLDVWHALRSSDPGLTGCQSADLMNESSRLTERLDFILCSRDLIPEQAGMTGNEIGDRIASGDRQLWPSDHAGVWSAIAVP